MVFMNDALSGLIRFFPKSFLTAFLGTKWVYIIQDKEIVVRSWREDRFGEEQVFSQSAAGQTEFGIFLSRPDLEQHTAYVLVDLIDEELQTHNIPGLRGAARKGLIERRLERLFRQTSYRRAVTQGRVSGGAERILFSGLTSPHLVRPWLQILQEKNIRIAGMWSIALLSSLLLHKIAPLSTNVLFVSLNSAGQRQTFFSSGQPLVSRLVPRQYGDIKQAAEAIYSETGRTRLYLNGLRLLSRELPLDVFVLCSAQLFDLLRSEPQKIIGSTIQPVAIDKLTTAAGLCGSLPIGEMELLFAQYLLQKTPRNQYATPEELKSIRYFVAKKMFPDEVAAAVVSTQGLGHGVRRVGDALLEMGAISSFQLEIALAEQQRLGHPLGKVLITLGFISEEKMRDLLGVALEQEIVDLDIGAVDSRAVRFIPNHFAKKHNILPLAWDEESKILTVATANTFNLAVLDKLQVLLPDDVTVKPKLAGESELSGVIDTVYGIELSIEGILREIETGEVDIESLAVDDGNFSNPMTRLVNALLTDAVKRESSDIHINPMSGFVQVRYRIDGVLREVRILQKKYFSGLVVRIKVLSGMDIAENRIPQDGHFSQEIANSTIDFRVSIQPTSNGENIVLRVLDRNKGLISLENLGINQKNIAILNKLMKQPEGIILVTGPTGCGKTTTLYSMLSTINAQEKNIMTLEDPVEYPLDSILQTSVNNAVDLGFATGVRSMLRQDPDIILVGEIRDLETAQMALRAAMTGHQVYSTLHANSAMAAIFRLLNIGLRPDMLAGNIIGILAQRLVRKLCRKCKQAYTPDKEAEVLLHGDTLIGQIYSAVGCDHCEGSGYKGRICVMEGLIIDDDFNDLISCSAPQSEFRQMAKDKNLVVMADSGRQLVVEGITSLGEVSRVLGMHYVEKL